MSGITKFLTGLLGIIALLACISTVGIIGYSLSGAGSKNAETAINNVKNEISSDVTEVSVDNDNVSTEASGDNDGLTNTEVTGQNTNDNGSELSQNNNGSELPQNNNGSELPQNNDESNSAGVSATPQSIVESSGTDEGKEPTSTKTGSTDPSHIHVYKDIVIKKATCLEAGQTRFVCPCGDEYVVDTLSTGHVPNDEWEVIKAPTKNTTGQRVKRCLYCDEIIVSETIPELGEDDKDTPKHEHLYVANTEREATCTLAGLRKHTCSCGDFYTESIPAVGHVGGKWVTTTESTVTTEGTKEVRCEVCGALLDIKKLPLVIPTPSASASASASGSSSPSQSQKPSPTPHSHTYSSYVVTPATCTEKGVRSFICSCGDSYAESIELDANNHKYNPTFVAPTETQQGYTIYTCVRCNFSYKDNYILPLTNKGEDSIASASPTPSASSEP